MVLSVAMGNWRLVSLTVLAFGVGVAASARADGGAPGQTTSRRSGFTGSCEIGTGWLGVEGPLGGSALGGALQLGWFVSERLAVVVGATGFERIDSPSETSTGRALTTNVTLWTVGAQYWPRARVWLRGAAGQYVLSIRDPGESSAAQRGKGLGATAAAGYVFCVDCAAAAELYVAGVMGHSTVATTEQGFSADGAGVQLGFGILWY